MKEITPEGIRYLYLSLDDTVNARWETELKGVEFESPNPYMIERIQKRQDIRPIFAKIPLEKGPVAPVYYLFWKSQVELVELDRDVENGTYRDRQFAPSILTRYQITICMKCYDGWHSLVLDGGFLYMMNPKVRNAKLADYKVLKCPSCGEYFRQDVVIIFEKAGTFPPPWAVGKSQHVQGHQPDDAKDES